jgi:hypothetical protein
MTLTFVPDVYSIQRYKEFKEFNKRICVATDVFGRGIDIEKINLAINYDLPAEADSYLHRVGRAGRFGTKGLSISFVSSEQDEEVLKQIQKRFEVAIPYVAVPACLHLLTCPVSSLRRVWMPAPTWQTRMAGLVLGGTVEQFMTLTMYWGVLRRFGKLKSVCGAF